MRDSRAEIRALAAEGRVWRSRLAIALLLAPLAGACTDTLLCTTEARAAISVNVIDAGTRVPIAGYRGIVRDGSYSDSLRFGGAAYERTGTYTVTIEADGYQTWTRSGIVVTDGECHVNGVSLLAELEAE